MGSDTHRKGSKVLLCFRQWGQVKEDLGGQEKKEFQAESHSVWQNLKKVKYKIAT